MGTTDTLQTLKHSDKEISSFIQKLSGLDVKSSYYLTLLAGENKSAKKDFYKKVKKQAGDTFKEKDLQNVISTQLDESTEKIDQMFEDLGSDKYIWLHNGDQLGGVYTSFSYSARRYATPQERYLFKKIKGSEKLFFLDLEDIYTVDNFLRRHTQTLITFEQPTTFLGKLKQISVHGSSFPSKRKTLT